MKSILISIIFALLFADNVLGLQLDSEMNLSTDVEEDEMVFLEMEEQSLKDEVSEEESDKKKDVDKKKDEETDDAKPTMKVGDPCPCSDS